VFTLEEGEALNPQSVSRCRRQADIHPSVVFEHLGHVTVSMTMLTACVPMPRPRSASPPRRIPRRAQEDSASRSSQMVPTSLRSTRMTYHRTPVWGSWLTSVSSSGLVRDM
jgi:hypothetical protein